MDICFNAITLDGNTLIKTEQKDYWLRIIELLVKEFSQQIDTRQLKSIIIPENYKVELFDYQKKVGVKQGYTDNDVARGIAQVVTGTSSEGRCHAVFISKELVFTLYDDHYLMEVKNTMDNQAFENLVYFRAIAINTLNHELAHIQEDNITSEISSVQELEENKNLVIHQLRQVAMILWREYYASRISAATHKINENDTTFIVSLCEEIEREILIKRRAYNLRELGLSDFVNLLHNKTNSLFKFSAYAFGNYFSLDSPSKHQIIEMVKEALDKTLYQDCWIRLGLSLDNLFEKYPNWNSIEVLDDLGKLILDYIKKFDINIYDTEEGVYYDIPVSEDLLK